MLGVSPSAWREACQAMGEIQAANCAGGNPAAIRPDQQRRRVSAQFDRQGEGWPVLDLADGHGASALPSSTPTRRCGPRAELRPRMLQPTTAKRAGRCLTTLLKSAQEAEIVMLRVVSPSYPMPRSWSAALDETVEGVARWCLTNVLTEGICAPCATARHRIRAAVASAEPSATTMALAPLYGPSRETRPGC
jgi:hypothetical protein